MLTDEAKQNWGQIVLTDETNKARWGHIALTNEAKEMEAKLL